MSFAASGAKKGLENILRIPKKTVAEAKRIFPSPGKIRPLELPDPLPTTSIITEQAQKVGGAERRRIKGLKGKRRTIFAGRRDLAPSLISRAGLKTTFG